MEEAMIAEVETPCRAIADEGNHIFSWVWDPRFDSVLTTISQKKAKEARAILDNCLYGFWDDSQVHLAPEEIKKIAELTGGVGENQLLFSSDPSLDAVSVGFWWPWNNGSCISLRIGMVPTKDSVDQAELDASLKNCFGL